MKNPIPAGLWKWFGTPGHFCGAWDCRFHLCTQVGPWLISTVGEWMPDPRKPCQELGSGRLYETMVFRAGEPCDRRGCRCGKPKITGHELDMTGTRFRGVAKENHMAMCYQWAERGEDYVTDTDC
jgi:hypothetical protein